MTESIKRLLEGNKEWVSRIKDEDPDFFERLAEGQSPEYLWIGCSDSRVPATEITNSVPGSIFVQRNIANLVVHTDSNLLSVAYFAVHYLKVKHIIVCGHYGCGGIKAAMSNESFGYLDNWLLHLKDVYSRNRDILERIESNEERLDRFTELNVKEQVSNLAKLSFIQKARKKGDYPRLHGWVYSVGDGLIKELKVNPGAIENLEAIYKYSSDT